MLTIGTLAKKTGTKVQTIRYYEQIGLMPEPGRTGGGPTTLWRRRTRPLVIRPARTATGILVGRDP